MRIGMMKFGTTEFGMIEFGMTKKYTFIRMAAVLSLLLLATTANAAQVRAWLDRNTMQMGETVTLNVEASDTAPGSAPDFAVLQNDFTLGGTQSSSSVEIVNGRTSAKLLWAVALEPKREGAITIPTLSVAGQATQPIMLTVQPMAPGGTKAGDDVYIEATVDPKTPYVQQEVTLTLKLFFAVNLVDGTLDDPQGEGVVVKRIGGQDANFAAEVGGRRYRVLERRYVLQPERSGTVALAPIMFRGHAMDRNDMNSFFTRGRNVTARAEPITLDVRPRPASSGSDAWLPAQSVTLSADGLNPGAKAHVGEPLTLTLHLKATGLGFEQLPELNLPKIDGAYIYPDKATTQNRDAGDVIGGERERKFAIVPNRSGRLTIPSIGIAWWDVVHDRPETASVPEVSLDVEGVPGAAAEPSPAAPVSKPTANPPTVTPAAPIASSSSSDETRMWRMFAIAALLLWVATAVIAIIAWRRRGPRATAPSAEVRAMPESVSVKARFRSACLNDDWTAAASAIIAWANARGANVRNLGELGSALGDAAQVTAIDELQRVLYADAPATNLASVLSASFKDGPRLRDDHSKPKPSQPLPPLYPNRVNERA
jgi:BatD DUF11 like domain